MEEDIRNDHGRKLSGETARGPAKVSGGVLHAEAVLDSQPKDAEGLEAWASVLFKAAWYVSEMGEYGKAYEMGFAASR